MGTETPLPYDLARESTLRQWLPHTALSRQSRVLTIMTQNEQEENRLIMAALFGRLNGLGRFSLLSQLRFPMERKLMEGGGKERLLTRSDGDGLELITARL